MGEKRLDFDAPLLSVRRIASKAQAKPKPVENPGFIPFRWEQSPGRPKSAHEPKISEKRFDEDADGSEMLSPDESFSDCSVSECSGGSLDGMGKNPEVQEFMMGRFLPAAVAMATGPLEISVPKDTDLQRRRRSSRDPLPYQHTSAVLSKFAYDNEEIESFPDENEDDEGFKGVGYFSRGCGLVPRFCLLNPVLGMRNHGSFARDADEQSWDESLDDGRKLRRESNQLTCWSDPQIVDGSYGNCSSRSPFHQNKGSVGVLWRELKGRKTVSFDWCERFGDRYEKLSPSSGRSQGPSSLSPTVDRTPSSKSGSVDAVAETADKRSEDDNVFENHFKISEPVVARLSMSSEHLNCEGRSRGNDDLLCEKLEEKEKNCADSALSILRPPPLPNSPSESWLQRTLPTVSSRYPVPQPLLGVQAQHRKQALWASSKDFKLANNIIPKPTWFAQVLTTPVVPQHEP